MADVPSFRMSLRVGAAAFLLLLASAAEPIAQGSEMPLTPSPSPFSLWSTPPLFEQTRQRPTSIGSMPPAVTTAHLAAAQVGDQELPLSFVSWALSGRSVNGTMRGVSFSTVGPAPWTVSLGKLDAAPSAVPLSSEAPGIVALGVSLKPAQRLSVAPRLILPLGLRPAARTGVGAAIRAQLNPQVSFLGDIGTTDTHSAGWTPLAAAGIVGDWARTRVETNVLRGGTSADDGTPLLGSLDRELARGQVQPLQGLTVSGLASRSRPTSGTFPLETKTTSFALLYDRLSQGQVSATTDRERSSSQQVSTKRLEWRRSSAGGLAVRYVHQTSLAATTDALRRVELDLPGWPGRRGGRIDLRTVLTSDPSTGGLALSSHLKGRVDVFDQIGLAGETELGLAGADAPHVLRRLRFTSDVALPHRTAVQLLCTYRGGTRFSMAQSIEARVSRTVPLFAR